MNGSCLRPLLRRLVAQKGTLPIPSRPHPLPVWKQQRPRPPRRSNSPMSRSTTIPKLFSWPRIFRRTRIKLAWHPLPWAGNACDRTSTRRLGSLKTRRVRPQWAAPTTRPVHKPCAFRAIIDEPSLSKWPSMRLINRLVRVENNNAYEQESANGLLVTKGNSVLDEPLTSIVLFFHNCINFE